MRLNYGLIYDSDHSVASYLVTRLENVGVEVNSTLRSL